MPVRFIPLRQIAQTIIVLAGIGIMDLVFEKWSLVIFSVSRGFNISVMGCVYKTYYNNSVYVTRNKSNYQPVIITIFYRTNFSYILIFDLFITDLRHLWYFKVPYLLIINK